jgi:hypothetical protein
MNIFCFAPHTNSRYSFMNTTGENTLKVRRLREIILYRDTVGFIGVKSKGNKYYISVTIADLEIFYKSPSGNEIFFGDEDLAWNLINSEFKFSVNSIFAVIEKLYATVKSENVEFVYFQTLKRLVSGYRTCNGLIREFKERLVTSSLDPKDFTSHPIPEGYYIYLQAKPTFGPIPYGSYNYKFYLHIKSDYRNITLRFLNDEIGRYCDLNDRPSTLMFALALDDILRLTELKLESIATESNDNLDLQEICRSVICFIESI